ncbi:probable folate-biopterin transporter 2 [Impatiens glandulifera]|uniref:probable folate-biopterin transporter 2 n=1 Tax=Impatiens glandulifera TaxID=253017 RepID=UPI001FB183CB|nr:probable folate-biopterin transporter 2 [Impatiens glandulifera]
MGEGEKPSSNFELEDESKKKRIWAFLWAPVQWLKMLSMEMHWSFVFGVVVVYGISQGLGGALLRVGTEFYMKDVQKVQPSEAQIYSGITNIPWIVKPIWGILTDVVPIFGYHRSPYFIFSGALGIISMLFLSMQKRLHLVMALVSLTASSAGAAIADVTVDACVAQNSGALPLLAADLQSLCALSSSIGSLLGFAFSGILVHLIGPKAVLGLLAIPSGLVLSVGILLKEPYIPNFGYRQVTRKFIDAAKDMWTTLKCPEVWRPCIYMFISLALSLNIHQGMFYWYTDAKTGPGFSQETIGFIYSIGSVGSLLGAILYQYNLKDHSFRNLCFWTQLLFGLSGMLDLVLILRLNLKLGIPDYLFVVIDVSVSHLIGRLKWMPLLVLSSKLCPPGIEGTLFALLMSIDNAGLLTASWAGGVLLHLLKVTRDKFDHLWLAVLVRNIMRLLPLCLLFLVPGGDPNSSILSTNDDVKEEIKAQEEDNMELVSLVSKDEGR